jgi:endonuclease/exonuclease/phosphatase family metal-dependent hydrolase
VDTIRVVWWNLQNLFDTVDDPIAKDFEFTGEHGWTDEVLAAKLTNLAAALNVTHDGQGPELLAVCEIEHDALLTDLIAVMGNPHLTVVEDPTGTRDLRGIDVAMAYDRRKLTLVDQRTHVIHLRYPTRDLFEVTFRVNATGTEFTVIACHWPSRSLGRQRSEASRIAAAENVAFLVRDRVRFGPEEYEALRAADDLETVRRRWETPVMVLGDLNDEPADAALVEHLYGSSELERVGGPTNDIDHFALHTADYRGDVTFLYNASWRFLSPENVGTFFIDRTRDQEFPNRYQVLDQLLVTRGFLTGAQGLRLDTDSIRIVDHDLVATGTGRPRRFDKQTRKGTSDHLPITAVLRY